MAPDVREREFDHVLDLSGYGTFCPFLFTAAKGSEKSLWLHSDLMAESQRDTAGDKHLEGRLNAVFTTVPLLRPPGVGLGGARPGQHRQAR